MAAYATYISQLSGHENEAATAETSFEAWLEEYKATAKTEFEEWFATIEGILGSDVAGQLAKEINALDVRVTDIENAIDGLSVLTSEAWLGASYCGSAYLSSIQ